MTRPQAPPGERIGPAPTPTRPDHKPNIEIVTDAGYRIPKFADPEKEKRFRRDQAGWCRRILRARRTSYDANDATVAPFNGGKWTQL